MHDNISTIPDSKHNVNCTSPTTRGDTVASETVIQSCLLYSGQCIMRVHCVNVNPRTRWSEKSCYGQIVVLLYCSCTEVTPLYGCL